MSQGRLSRCLETYSTHMALVLDAVDFCGGYVCAVTRCPDIFVFRLHMRNAVQTAGYYCALGKGVAFTAKTQCSSSIKDSYGDVTLGRPRCMTFAGV